MGSAGDGQPRADSLHAKPANDLAGLWVVTVDGTAAAAGEAVSSAWHVYVLDVNAAVCRRLPVPTQICQQDEELPSCHWRESKSQIENLWKSAHKYTYMCVCIWQPGKYRDPPGGGGSLVPPGRGVPMVSPGSDFSKFLFRFPKKIAEIGATFPNFGPEVKAHSRPA